MSAEMDEQPAVLARLVDRIPDDLAAVRAARPANFCGTVMLGRGSSDNAAQLSRYLTERLSGRPAGLAAISVHTRNPVRVDLRGYVVVAFSQSGHTPEVVAAVARMRAAGGRVVAVTNGADSPLASEADVLLPLDAGAELAVPATKTVSAQMLLGAVLACGLADTPRPAILDGLRRLPGRSAAILTDPNPARELANRWRESTTLLVVSRGLGYAAAAETALKVRETAGIFAEGISTADLLHGPIASLRPGQPVLLLPPGGGMDADVLEVAERGRAARADVRTWSAPEWMPAAAGGTEPDVSAELETAIAATLRGQQLAAAWAAGLGLDPDRPAGLTKVTRTG